MIDHRRYGYIDKKGEKVIPAKYNFAWKFSDDVAQVREEHKLSGYINKHGDYVIRPEFRSAHSFHEGLALVKRNDIMCYINKRGEVIVSCSENITGFDVNGFKSGRAGACIKGEDGIASWGYIDKTGKFVISPCYRDVRQFSENLAAVQSKNKLWGYIDKTGKTVIENNYEEAYQFHCGVAVVFDRRENMKMCINKEGGVVFRDEERNLAHVADFSENLARIVVKDKKGNRKYRMGHINLKGEIAIEPNLYYAGDFHNGLACACIDPKQGWGYMDTKGEMVISSVFRSAFEFSEGLASVMTRDRKVGYIDVTGKLVIEPRYSFGDEFSEGMAIFAE